MPIEIHDSDDERVALYRNLRDAALRRRVEGGHGIFVVEGARSVRQLVGSPWPLRSVLLRPEQVTRLADLVTAVEGCGVPVFVAGQAVFDQIAGFPVHRGVLALGERRPDPDPAAVLAGVDIALIVEGVNDSENMGAIFRNAAAFGVGAILLDPACCDPLYRRAVRVSVGHVLRVPFSRLVPWPDSLADLTAAGLAVLALDPAALDSIDSMRARRPVALMVGAEGPGLSEAAQAMATHRAGVAMSAGVDSLNVATAVAIALDRLTSPVDRSQALSRGYG